jgi:hypothetical protein
LLYFLISLETFKPFYSGYSVFLKSIFLKIVANIYKPDFTYKFRLLTALKNLRVDVIKPMLLLGTTCALIKEENAFSGL